MNKQRTLAVALATFGLVFASLPSSASAADFYVIGGGICQNGEAYFSPGEIAVDRGDGKLIRFGLNKPYSFQLNGNSLEIVGRQIYALMTVGSTNYISSDGYPTHLDCDTTPNHGLREYVFELFPESRITMQQVLFWTKLKVSDSRFSFTLWKTSQILDH